MMMFSFVCTRCDLPGATREWPPRARCPLCKRSDKMVPMNMGADQYGEVEIVHYPSDPAAQ